MYLGRGTKKDKGYPCWCDPALQVKADISIAAALKPMQALLRHSRGRQGLQAQFLAWFNTVMVTLRISSNLSLSDTCGDTSSSGTRRCLLSGVDLDSTHTHTHTHTHTTDSYTHRERQKEREEREGERENSVSSVPYPSILSNWKGLSCHKFPFVGKAIAFISALVKSDTTLMSMQHHFYWVQQRWMTSRNGNARQQSSQKYHRPHFVSRR